MSIKIHHGPPGSYKTSGAVMDDFIPAARAGRTIVTNIRGLNDPDRVRAALGDDTIPDEFQLFHLPTTEHDDAAENREQLAKWFHWLPHGALLMLDEAQMIWPKTWKDSDLARLDYPGGIDAASHDNRPHNWAAAFEMHRHYGWDMVLTTPNIDRLRPDVRQCSEGAYKHKNQAIIGLKGLYLEAFHMADDSGKSASDFLTLRNRRIKPEVWKLYDSTATGNFSDTIAGLSLLANPRVLLLLGVLASALGWFISSGPPAVLGGKKATPPVQSIPPPSGPPVAGWAQPPSDNNPRGKVSPFSNPATPAPNAPVSVAPSQTHDPEPLADLDLFISGRYGTTGHLTTLFVSPGKHGLTHYRDHELTALGYQVKTISNCLARLIWQGQQHIITCRPRTKPEGGSREDVGRPETPLTALVSSDR